MRTTVELVTPFRGERFRDAARLGALIAPPYDVITPEERARLAAADPHNIVHLSLPETPGGGDRFAHAGALLEQWRREGVLVRDAAPTVYILAQEFALPSGERRTRLGMFAAVAAEPYESGRVRPHERTHARVKAERLALLRATRTSLEAILLLVPDPQRSLAEALVRLTAGAPAARGELGGVRLRLWVVGGDEAARLAASAGRQALYIADGHHRYETAVAYARESPTAGRVVAFLVSTADPGLVVLPTHRVIYGADRDPGGLVEKWGRWFDVQRLPMGTDPLAHLTRTGASRIACVVACPEGGDVSLVLRRDAPLDAVPGGPALRQLDAAVIEALVVHEILGAGHTTPTLKFTADPREALDAVRKGVAAAAVLVNPTRVEQIIAVADAGGVMPPKSTYFVPKVPSGVVLLPAD
ncbi:MAG: DUF1015 family protein [Gemmatimonadales bacterium]